LRIDPPKKDSLKRCLTTNSTQNSNIFRIIFISVLLSAAVYMFLLLVSSKGSQQDSIFYGNSHDYFMDFFNVLKYVSKRDPYHYTDFMGLGEKAYPPLAYAILFPFSRLYDYKTKTSYDARSTQLGIMSVFFFLFICIFFLTFLYSHHIQGSVSIKILTTLTFFMSGIFIYSLERANIIFLAVLFLGIFLFFYKSTDPILREIAYLALACTTALKVYPVVFGILILKDKRWFAAIRTMLYGIVAFFLPFFFFYGGLSNFKQLLSNVEENSLLYLFITPSYRFGWLPYYLCTNTYVSNYQSWITFGNILMLLAVVLSFFMKSQWKTVTLLTCTIIASPVNSAYYCGLYLFAAIILFLNENEHNCFDIIYLVLFIVILNPFQFIANGVAITIFVANCSLLCLYLLLMIDAIMQVGIWGSKQIGNKKSHVHT